MLELMVVIVIIGILASLAYSSLIDMVFTNRAKETAQAMRTFAETSLMEAKRQGKVVTLKRVGSNMEATFRKDASDNNPTSKRQPLSDGFSNDATTNYFGVDKFNVNDGVTSKQIIGVSGITTPGFFIACGGKGYCGAIVKRTGKNSFEAHITKDNGVSWREI